MCNVKTAKCRFQWSCPSLGGRKRYLVKRVAKFTCPSGPTKIVGVTDICIFIYSDVSLTNKGERDCWNVKFNTLKFITAELIAQEVMDVSRKAMNVEMLIYTNFVETTH